MSWADEYVAIDTETTGVGASARIVEVAAVTFSKGEPVREWSRLLCPPDVDWESPKVKEALAVNKITREQLSGQPTFAEVLPDLLLELSCDVWVAHNMDFDRRMLVQEHTRLERLLVLPPLSVCTLNLAVRLNTGGGRNKLHDVAARYGVKQEDAHRAAVDARVCGLILAAMFKEGRLPVDHGPMADLCRPPDAAWKGRPRW
jgi:DNA polymerase-3 subunit epsilon